MRVAVALFGTRASPRAECCTAVLLADVDGLYQEQAAAQMNVSRPTVSRILDSAHRKLADALVHGKALRIEGGPVQVAGRRCCRLHDDENQGSR